LALGIVADNLTLTQLLAQSALDCGDKVALRIQRDGVWHELTYRRFFQAAQRFGRQLVERGYSPGDRVVLYGESQPEWVVAYFACVAAGLTVVPLDPQTPIEEVNAVVRFTETRVLFHSSNGYENRPPNGAHPFVAEDVHPLGDVLTGLDDLAHEPDSASRVLDCAQPDMPASVIFTAGTTIDPRGAVLTHRNFVANVLGVSAVLEPFREDQFVSILPLNHAFEFTNGLLIPIAAGATVSYSGSLKPRRILDVLQESKATVMLGMPRIYQMLYEIVRRRRRDDPDSDISLRSLFGDSLRVLVSGGAALDPDVYAAFLDAGIPIHEGYGLTETAPVLTVNPYHKTKRSSVGKPLPGVEIRIESPGADGIGEIVARGPNLMQGYYRNPAATEKSLRNGWLYTGDLGFLNEDGYLYITGRIKDVIVTSAGKNVYPDEVELLYKGLPHVREMCVVGLKDESNREEVHAVLVVSRHALTDAASRRDIQNALQDIGSRIPSYQRVQHVHYWTHDIPKTHSLKVKREEVRAMLENDATPDETEPTELAIPAPSWERDSWQERLVQEIARIAGVDFERIRPGDRFDNDLHLDSLMKVELLAMLETNLHITLPDHIALKFQTVQDVLEYIAPYMKGEEQSNPAFASRAVTLEALPSKEYESRYLNKSSVQQVVATLFRFGARVFYRTVFQLSATGVENLPTTGPFILAANHQSHLDSAAILSSLKGRARNLHVLGAKDYFFDSYVKGWFVATFLNVLPFDRHGDFVRSLGLSQRAVQLGRSLLIFPEGTRSRTGEIQPFKPGLGFLALELGVPVVPVYIDGTYRAMPKGQRLPKPTPVRVFFGDAISVDDYQSRCRCEPHYPLYREITQRVQVAVEALKRRFASEL
jgi:long-chain acyl-CoA synthetase